MCRVGEERSGPYGHRRAEEGLGGRRYIGATMSHEGMGPIHFLMASSLNSCKNENWNFGNGCRPATLHSCPASIR
jgi:hypothetical protein